MDHLLKNLLQFSRFTTNTLPKEFLPRRVGLGYQHTETKINREIIRKCLKTKRKEQKLRDKGNTVVDAEDSDDDLGKSKMIKTKNI